MMAKINWKWFCQDCLKEMSSDDFELRCANPKCGEVHEPDAFIDYNRKAFKKVYPDGRIDTFVSCFSCEEKKQIASMN